MASSGERSNSCPTINVKRNENQELILRLIIVRDGRAYPRNTEYPEPCSNTPGGEPTPILAFLEGAAVPGSISWYSVWHPLTQVLYLSHKAANTRLASNWPYHQWGRTKQDIAQRTVHRPGEASWLFWTCTIATQARSTLATSTWVWDSGVPPSRTRSRS